MSYRSDLRQKVRERIGDVSGTLRDDSTIDMMLEQASRAYSIVTGCNVSKEVIVSGDDCIYKAPDNYIKALKYILPNDFEGQFYSWKYLNDNYGDFTQMESNEPYGLVSDLCGFGRFRIFPKVPTGTNCGTIYYCRINESLEEVKCGENAILEHCMFTEAMLSNKDSIATHYAEFMKLANHDKATGFRSIKTRQDTRRGRYF